MNDIFERVVELKKERRSFCLTTLIKEEGSSPRDLGTRMLVFPDGKIDFTIGGGALEKLVIKDALVGFKKKENFTKKYNLTKNDIKGEIPTGMYCGGNVEVLFEYFYPEEILIIFGAGHVAKAIAKLCNVLKFPYIIVDNRKDYAKKEYFPGVSEVVRSNYKESFKNLSIDENTYIIIVTYCHQFDSVCLEESLKTKAKYIGMIGSQNKVKTILKEIKKKGIKIDNRVYSPVGLDIGGNSPEEIALSIVSEILKVKYNLTGKSMRELL